MTANHPEDLVARLTARASSANGNGRPAGGYWPDDAELDRQAAALITSLVGERDALRAALTRLLLRYDSVARDLGIEPDTQDVVITSRALASPHQEGTGT